MVPKSVSIYNYYCNRNATPFIHQVPLKNETMQAKVASVQ